MEVIGYQKGEERRTEDINGSNRILERKGKERRTEDINGSNRILERKGEQRNVEERRGEIFYHTCIRVWMRI